MPADVPQAYRGANVSVIIPAYMAAGTIARALASIGAQSQAPGEVIVIDDGSGDQTVQAAQAAEFSLHGIPLTILRQSNVGAGAARNRGVEIAKGSLLAFLDADDEWLPKKLERSLERMNLTGAMLVAHDGWIIVSDDRPALNTTARRFAEGSDAFVSLYRKGYIDTCSVVVERDAVLAAGGFDETLPNAQDFELWLAMLHKPDSTFDVFAEPLVRYHVIPGSIMSHTDRRLSCCIEIAVRYAPTLKDRPGGMYGNLMYRMLAIHYEAVCAHLAKRRTLAVLRILIGLPFRIAAAIGALNKIADGARPSFLGSASAER